MSKDQMELNITGRKNL